MEYPNEITVNEYNSEIMLKIEVGYITLSPYFKNEQMNRFCELAHMCKSDYLTDLNKEIQIDDSNRGTWIFKKVDDFICIKYNTNNTFFIYDVKINIQCEKMIPITEKVILLMNTFSDGEADYDPNE